MSLKEYQSDDGDDSIEMPPMTSLSWQSVESLKDATVKSKAATAAAVIAGAPMVTMELLDARLKEIWLDILQWGKKVRLTEFVSSYCYLGLLFF